MQQHGSKYFARRPLTRGINLTNLHCLTSVWPGDTSDSRNSSFIISFQFI